jgi:argininosuccinate synthase
MKKKVVLAFSGGLDTSYCVKYLSREKDLDVYSVLVNTGGFTAAELTKIKQKAKDLGAVQHENIEVTATYYENCIRFLVYGNILKNGTYPLSVSAERVFQAMAIADYVKKVEADYVAHGSTGAGNDQVRFDLIFNIMNPDVEIITPIRDLQLSRSEEIKYLQSQGIDLDWQEAQYSINQGLWGTSVGGKETLSSDQPLPQSAFPTEVSEKEVTKISLSFRHGQICAVNENGYKNPVDAIKTLNNLAASYGLGRDIHVGDTIIGIKGRVGFEAAAPILIIKAHQTLEKHTLTKWQIHWKDQLATWYGMLLHEGQFLDPVMRDIEVFLENTQKTVNGEVYLNLAPYRYEILGIQSPNDLMSADFGAYGEKNLAWTGEDVRGFSKILSNQSRIYRTVNSGDKND